MITLCKDTVNPVMHNVEKWPIILLRILWCSHMWEYTKKSHECLRWLFNTFKPIFSFYTYTPLKHKTRGFLMLWGDIPGNACLQLVKTKISIWEKNILKVTKKNHEIRCVIRYHLYNIENMKNSHGGVLLVVKLQAFSRQLY